MEWRVPLSDLDYGRQEEEAVLGVLRSRWLTMGEVSAEFERRFAAMLGVRHAVAVSNGTVALHLACLALGIGPGDEVIVPSLTFVATANAVLYTGARVRFADILGPYDLTISPQSVLDQITAATKAMIVMHYGGFPCQMAALKEIAGRHGLALVEDAAHAPGGSLNGTALGTWGDIGCFSFFSNKNLVTGEGGMLVTNRDDLAAQVRLLRSHGMSSLTWDRHQGHAYSYDVSALGYNYRIDELRSALGLVQLEKLARNNARRRDISEQYWQEFDGLDIGLPFRDAVGESAFHIFPVLLPPDSNRIKFIEAMRAEGIQTSIHYPPIHRFEYYCQQYPGVSLPVTEGVASREVTLPLYPAMGAGQVAAVIAAVKNSLHG